MKRDLFLRRVVGDAEIENHSFVLITLQIAIPGWVTMEEKEEISASKF
jgi:hypothetical protein